MSAWKHEALRLIPGIQDLVQSASSPMALWIELWHEFKAAFDAGDAARLNGILKYAEWCTSPLSGPLPNDASTAATCSFYEDLPTERAFWPHLSEWLGVSRFNSLKDRLSYHLSAQEFEELESVFIDSLP